MEKKHLVTDAIPEPSTELDPLSAIAVEMGTDKGPFGHYYTSVYHDVLNIGRDTCKKVLEIGVLQGSSLRMWLKYFKNATVYGIDKSFPFFEYKDNTGTRLKLFYADQGNPNDLNEFLRLHCMPSDKASFDLIVDDGSHMQHHQQISLACLFPFVKPGGVYIIEDVHMAFFNEKAYNPTGCESTLRMLERFRDAGVLESVHINTDGCEFIKRHTEKVEIYWTRPELFGNQSITAVIYRKQEGDRR